MALGLLVIPLVLLLLARLPGRPREIATGTLRIWRELSKEHRARTGPSQRRFPTWLLFALGALLLGVLALAGPRAEQRLLPRRWTVVVDRSPGMGLPWLGTDQDVTVAPTDAPTRISVALKRLKAHLLEAGTDGDSVTWRAEGREALTLSLGDLPPLDWSLPNRSPFGAAPQWDRFAQAGALWVTDRRPSVDRGKATLILSGGAAVSGPIAQVDDEVLLWSPSTSQQAGTTTTGSAAGGALILLSSNQAGEGGVAVPPLNPLLEELVRSWARSRGLREVRSVHLGEDLSDVERADALSDPDVVLVIDSPRVPGGERSFDLQEPLLWASGTTSPPEPSPVWPGPPSEWALTVRWRTAATVNDKGQRVDGLALLSSSPGWARFHINSLEKPGGDPAAFAVRVAGLLDEALLPPPGVVPVGARRDAGQPGTVPGEPAPQEFLLGAVNRSGWDPWLAGMAAFLALLAILLRRAPR